MISSRWVEGAISHRCLDHHVDTPHSGPALAASSGGHFPWNLFLLSPGPSDHVTSQIKGKGKAKAIPLQALTGPESSRRLRLPNFKTISTWRWQGCQPYAPPGNIPGTHFCWRLSRPQGHTATGTIMQMEKSGNTIGNRTRDLLVRNAVPQPLRYRVPPLPVRYHIHFLPATQAIGCMIWRARIYVRAFRIINQHCWTSLEFHRN
jgi:hypothetical protein